MVKTTTPFFRLHLQVSQCCNTPRAPIDNPLAPINHALMIEGNENAPHSFRKTFVHGEALSTPIATCS